MPIMIVRDGKLTFGNPGGNSYDGEKQMGSLSNMWTWPSDANNFVNGSYQTLTERSTSIYHTYAPVRGAVNKQVDYGIGPGLVFRSQPDFQRLGMTRESAVSWGKEFQKIIHWHMRKFNFYEKQSVLFRGALVSGDSFLVFLRDETGAIVDLVELSGDQIDSQYNDEKATLGIYHDEWLRHVGARKLDGKRVDYTDKNGNQNLVQFYLKELPRQLRGYPLAYSIINLARNDDTHTDAITHRAVLEAILFATFKSSGTDIDKQMQSLAAKNRAQKRGGIGATLSRLGNAIKMGAGNIMRVNTDEEFEMNDLKTPSNTFPQFKEWLFNYAAMATGTPPEVAMSKYSTSFTGHKGALNDFVISYTKKRKTFERSVMGTVIREIAKDAIINRWITAPGFFDNPMTQDAYLQGMFLGPVPGHINPMVEVNADAAKVKNAFALRSDMALKNGHDFDNMIQEWAMEQDEFTAHPQTYVDKIAGQEEQSTENEDKEEDKDA